MDTNPSILSHVSIGTNDFARAIAFYDAQLVAGFRLGTTLPESFSVNEIEKLSIENDKNDGKNNSSSDKLFILLGNPIHS